MLLLALAPPPPLSLLSACIWASLDGDHDDAPTARVNGRCRGGCRRSVGYLTFCAQEAWPRSDAIPGPTPPKAAEAARRARLLAACKRAACRCSCVRVAQCAEAQRAAEDQEEEEEEVALLDGLAHTTRARRIPRDKGAVRMGPDWLGSGRLLLLLPSSLLPPPPL